MRFFNYLFRLLKEVKNPPLFLYHLFHFTNINIPLFLSRIIEKRNRSDYLRDNIRDILFHTYDGSGQVVHPDMTIWGEKCVVVFTPYPYGMEEYENPCLYIGDSLESLEEILVPLDVQAEHKRGYHMSDPSIAAFKDSIYCVYRDTINTKDFIYLKKIKCNDGSYIVSDRVLLIDKTDEYVLSPAILLDVDLIYMYHVKTDKHESQLILNTFDSTTYIHHQTYDVTIIDAPEEYYLWHIGISSDNDLDKFVDSDCRLKGLFLYISQSNNKLFRLFVTQNIAGDLLSWKIIKEVNIPREIKDVMKFPYKSCFEPRTGKILLSFRDTKDRNRLALIDCDR